MRDVVNYLREVWYENGDKFPRYHPLKKDPVDCRKLWKTCLDIAGTKFVPICEGISGEIGSLKIGETFVDAQVDLLIDTLVINLTKERVKDDDISEVEEVQDNRGRLIF